MKFINSFPKFDEVIEDAYEFYYTGTLSMTADQVIEQLRAGKFPSQIKGNFAFFFKDSNRTVICVDHLPNYNMFYSNEYCSNIFLTLQQVIKKAELPCTHNSKIRTEILLYWGGSVGEETTKHEIKRVLPGCYLEVLPDGKSKSVEYRDLYCHETENYSINDLSDIIESFIKTHTTEPFGLLQSSGTDSSTILGYFRKLGLEKQAAYISLRSTNEFSSETPYIEKLAEHYNNKIHWYDIGEFGGKNRQILDSLDQEQDPVFFSAYHRTYSAFWTEPHVLLKYKAIKDLGFGKHVIFTGEVGDQVFGSRFGKALLKFIIQKPNADAEEIAELFLTADFSRFRTAGYRSSFMKDTFEMPVVKQAKEHAKEWFVNTWNRLEVDDLINKIELIQYLYKGSHRVYNYNQFPDVKFAHPFASNEVFENIWKIPGNLKVGQGGRSRLLSYALIKDHMVEWPWLWDKTGVSVMSMDRTFKEIKGFLNGSNLGSR